MSPALKAAVEIYVARSGNGDGLIATPVADLVLMKTSKRLLPHHMIYKPALCVVAQGAKQITLGDAVFDYAEGQALVVGVELPAFGSVTRAPYLGMTLEFDTAVLREVLEKLDPMPRPAGEVGLGLFVETLNEPLADALLRLVRMLDAPQAVAVLYPSLMREICYWLLTGPNGGEICKLALATGHAQRIAAAIHLLRDNFARAIRIEELAEAACMSPSSFHQHFKALTAMTPLQYQKQLRLLEARRLMAADAANVTHAAFQVGYESASQFSREYSRMFGIPPKRDAMNMKAMPEPV
ncbi:AraC family transcriptional regulator [Bradyrhizobium sp. dw_78]|uniref:AraC family transcriptional regulator n=1 Tax=Bradyrhizobium sp. dw_78 TaxID=2719793 RepID=UPI001BD637E4|nr:AraC family transcriptional regulator [Bradyrhizobium sp. dw_78]